MNLLNLMLIITFDTNSYARLAQFQNYIKKYVIHGSKIKPILVRVFTEPIL